MGAAEVVKRPSRRSTFKRRQTCRERRTHWLGARAGDSGARLANTRNESYSLSLPPEKQASLERGCLGQAFGGISETMGQSRKGSLDLAPPNTPSNRAIRSERRRSWIEAPMQKKRPPTEVAQELLTGNQVEPPGKWKQVRRSSPERMAR
jgi:hypothetical protein